MCGIRSTIGRPRRVVAPSGRPGTSLVGRSSMRNGTQSPIYNRTHSSGGRDHSSAPKAADLRRSSSSISKMCGDPDLRISCRACSTPMPGRRRRSVPSPSGRAAGGRSRGTPERRQLRWKPDDEREVDVDVGFPVRAGTVSTLIFASGMLPMLVQAARTRNVRSYSCVIIALSNVGNVIHSVLRLPDHGIAHVLPGRDRSQAGLVPLRKAGASTQNCPRSPMNRSWFVLPTRRSWPHPNVKSPGDEQGVDDESKRCTG
jgi:hypothetical protein